MGVAQGKIIFLKNNSSVIAFIINNLYFCALIF
jgi:hypothetical protein